MAIYRATILNPQSENECVFIKDGGLDINEKGVIANIGRFDDVIKDSREKVIEVGDSIMIPAFADIHVHMPQSHIRGKFENQLLPWLRDCIWPEESKFKDEKFADDKAENFYRNMARQGTLLSLVFGTIHENALHSIFNNKIGHTIAGNVLMNQNSPEYLTQDTNTAIDMTEKLAKEYGENYAVTPRFAPTCTMELMEKVAKIAKKYRTWIQTHLAENPNEVKWVNELFPECSSYTDVYKQAGLLGHRTVMAHCIHMSDEELEMIKKSGTKIAHCPTSNIALGSGRMQVERIKEFQISFALASDVGAGPSLSMLHVMQKYMEQHKEEGINIRPEDALYRATLAGAEVLDMFKKTGNLNPGKEANIAFVKTSQKPDSANEAILDITNGSIQDLEKKIRKVLFKGNQI